VLDRALKTVPDALSVLKDQRTHLADALTALGRFAAVTADSVNQTRENLVKELQDIGRCCNRCRRRPALTRSLSFFSTFHSQGHAAQMDAW